MIQEYIRSGDRQSGKTHDLMTEIHLLIVEGERPNILVVFPSTDYVYSWIHRWRERFPHIPPPSYVSISNTLAVRGRTLKFVYVEDVDLIRDGWRNEKFNSIALWPDGKIVYTVSKPEWANKTFDDYIAPPSAPRVVSKSLLQRFFKRSKPELDGQ